MLQLLLLLLFAKSSAGLRCQPCCSHETGPELCKIDPPVCTIPEPKCVHAEVCRVEPGAPPGTEPVCTSTGEPEVCTSPEPVCTSPEPVCTITKPEGCTECPKSPPMDCASGHLTKDVCGCCDVCAKAEGETCGGMWGMSGTCAPGLNCETAKPLPNTKPYFNHNEAGVCVKDSTGQDTSCCDPGPKEEILDYHRMPRAEGPNSKFNYMLGEWKLIGCGLVTGEERYVGDTWADDCNTCNCQETGIVICTRKFCGNIPGPRPTCPNDEEITGECMCSQVNCAIGSYCLGGTTCSSFPDAKCFQESTALVFHDIGKNQWGQTTAPDWTISEGGAKLVQNYNTRPSLGVSDLGNPKRPISYNGRVFSDVADHDVIGVVFGFRDKKNFFVVASASTNRPGPTNWYVGRVHATCTSCDTTTTISDAIWDPTAHKEDITILSSGTSYWNMKNFYIYSICFDPSKLLMSVTIIEEKYADVGGPNTTFLNTGTISAKTNKPAVDDESVKGGFIGVYVDSQQGTTWERLECTTCKLTKLSCGVVNGTERNVGATWYQYPLTSSTLPDDCNTCNCLENGIVSCTKMLCANIPGVQREESDAAGSWSRLPFPDLQLLVRPEFQTVDPCTEPFGITGRCKGTFERWSFNQKEERCQQFIYGGCEGNQNNYRSFEECTDVCKSGVEGPSVCSKYTTLEDTWRRINYDNRDNFTWHCDKSKSDSRYTNLTTGWYRFTGAAGTKLPTAPAPGGPPTVDKMICGTQAVAYILSGGNPTIGDGHFHRRLVCWEYVGRGSDNCFWKTTVIVAACKDAQGDYLVYLLQPAPACAAAYCAIP